jgi:pantoate--beta-alanine ligase
VLQAMRASALAGMPRSAVEAEAQARLAAAGFAVDYAALRKPDLTEPAEGEDGERVALVAARLGRTRLIDNLEFAVP